MLQILQVAADVQTVEVFALPNLSSQTVQTQEEDLASSGLYSTQLLLSQFNTCHMQLPVCPGQTAAYLFWKKDWIFFCPVRAAASAIVFCFFDTPLASPNFFAGDFFAGAFGGSTLFAWALGSGFWSAEGPTFTVAPPSASTASSAQQVKGSARE